MKAAVAHLRRSDPVMAKLMEQVGPCRLSVLEPTFETLARSITFQQLHGKAAATIFGRVKAAVGPDFTPQAFLRVPEEQLRACGLSRQKMASLLDLAAHAADNRIEFARLPDLDNDAVLETLTQVRGVGAWTAQMFLMFALSRHDVLPVGDLGIRNAVKRAYRLRELPKPVKLERIAEKWRPYRTVACWYLWRSLDGEANIG